MEKEFVDYDQALALKELGYESPYPIGGYQGGKVFYYEEGELYYDGRPMYSSDAHSGQLLAPLFQQVFRWLRETHNIDVDVVRDSEVHYQDETRWIVKASDWNDIRVKDFPIAQLKFPNTSHHTDFKTYDEALAKGLEEALKFIKK